MPFASVYSWNFREKILKLPELENDILFCFLFLCYWVFQSILFCFFNESHLCFHMMYHLFLHYWWFLQNLETGFIQTNMHTTVILPKISFIFQCLDVPIQLLLWSWYGCMHYLQLVLKIILLLMNKLKCSMCFYHQKLTLW